MPLSMFVSNRKKMVFIAPIINENARFRRTLRFFFYVPFFVSVFLTRAQQKRTTFINVSSTIINRGKNAFQMNRFSGLELRLAISSDSGSLSLSKKKNKILHKKNWRRVSLAQRHSLTYSHTSCTWTSRFLLFPTTCVLADLFFSLRLFVANFVCQ